KIPAPRAGGGGRAPGARGRGPGAAARGAGRAGRSRPAGSARKNGPVIPNVLAGRYATAELVRIWSPEEKVRAERRLWLAVLRAQRDLGVAVPDGVVEAYEAVVDRVDLAGIAARERVTRHDVKARIEEFNALAGYEHIHKGMTSRDLTETVEQVQIRDSLRLIPERTAAQVARPPPPPQA